MNCSWNTPAFQLWLWNWNTLTDFNFALMFDNVYFMSITFTMRDCAWSEIKQITQECTTTQNYKYRSLVPYLLFQAFLHNFPYPALLRHHHRRRPLLHLQRCPLYCLISEKQLHLSLKGSWKILYVFNKTAFSSCSANTNTAFELKVDCKTVFVAVPYATITTNKWLLKKAKKSLESAIKGICLDHATVITTKRRHTWMCQTNFPRNHTEHILFSAYVAQQSTKMTQSTAGFGQILTLPLLAKCTAMQDH